MARYYVDTSAVLPYYREETNSIPVQRFLSALSPPVSISHLTEVEFASALSRLVRMGELAEAQAALIQRTIADFQE